MDLTQLKTNTGKTIVDFKISEKLVATDPGLIQLIIESESMNDSERQYWFNLTDVMNEVQINKLRDILTREKQKLAEIDAKYNKKPVDPVEAARKAKEMASQRQAQQATLANREKAHEAEEKAEEAAALAELEAL